MISHDFPSFSLVFPVFSTAPRVFFNLGELPGFLRAHGHALQTPAPSLEGGKGQSQ